MRLLAALILALPASIQGLTLASDSQAQVLGGIPLEFARIQAGLKDMDEAEMDKRLNSMEKMITHMGERELTKLAEVVQAMFPVGASDLQGLQEWKHKNPEMVQSLIQTGSGSNMTGIAATVATVANVAIGVADVGTVANQVGCFMHDMLFQPCTTWNLCLGVVQATATMPSWLSKTWMGKDLNKLRKNLETTRKVMKWGPRLCSLANIIVAPRMQPMAGVLWEMKEKIQSKLPVGRLREKPPPPEPSDAEARSELRKEKNADWTDHKKEPFKKQGKDWEPGGKFREKGDNWRPGDKGIAPQGFIEVKEI